MQVPSCMIDASSLQYCGTQVTLAQEQPYMAKHSLDEESIIEEVTLFPHVHWLCIFLLSRTKLTPFFLHFPCFQTLNVAPIFLSASSCSFVLQRGTHNCFHKTSYNSTSVWHTDICRCLLEKWWSTEYTRFVGIPIDVTSLSNENEHQTFFVFQSSCSTNSCKQRLNVCSKNSHPDQVGKVLSTFLLWIHHQWYVLMLMDSSTAFSKSCHNFKWHILASFAGNIESLTLVRNIWRTTTASRRMSGMNDLISFANGEPIK